MTNISQALGYFKVGDILEKENFPNDVWQRKIGPALVLLGQYGYADVYESISEDYLVVGQLTASRRAAKSRL